MGWQLMKNDHAKVPGFRLSCQLQKTQEPGQYTEILVRSTQTMILLHPSLLIYHSVQGKNPQKMKYGPVWATDLPFGQGAGMEHGAQGHYDLQFHQDYREEEKRERIWDNKCWAAKIHKSLLYHSKDFQLWTQLVCLCLLKKINWFIYFPTNSKWDLRYLKYAGTLIYLVIAYAWDYIRFWQPLYIICLYECKVSWNH